MENEVKGPLAAILTTIIGGIILTIAYVSGHVSPFAWVMWFSVIIFAGLSAEAIVERKGEKHNGTDK